MVHRRDCDIEKVKQLKLNSQPGVDTGAQPTGHAVWLLGSVLVTKSPVYLSRAEFLFSKHRFTES